MMEWLDYVNEHDVVLGRASREFIHQQRLMHRSAHVILSNSHGDVFLQLRSRTKDTGAGLWDTSAAGHVDSGESYLDCAVRELQEELGITVASEELREIGRLLPEARNGFEFTRIYRAQSDQGLVLQCDEIEDGRWLSPPAIDRWMQRRPAEFTQAFHLIWSKARTQLPLC